MNGQRLSIQKQPILPQSFLDTLQGAEGLSAGLICPLASNEVDAVGGAVGLRERIEAMEGKASGGRLCVAIDDVEGKASGGRLLTEPV